MPDIPPGWAAIDAAVIAVIGGPLVFFLIRILGKLKKVQADTSTTVFHVANEHKDDQGDPINFRDDTDAKHAEIVDIVTGIATRVEGIDGRIDGVERTLRGVQRDVGRLGDADLEHVKQQNRDREQARKDRERLENLERTMPRDELGRFIKRAQRRKQSEE